MAQTSIAQTNGNSTVQVSQEGLEQMRGAHERHYAELSGASSETEQMVQALQTGNPFGAGADGEAVYQTTGAFTALLQAAVQREQDNMEKLWNNFRTWGELVANTDIGAADAISDTAGLGGR